MITKLCIINKLVIHNNNNELCIIHIQVGVHVRFPTKTVPIYSAGRDKILLLYAIRI